MIGSIVAIVGRPNVGKSTLFNRLTATRTAIVEKVAGITRDRLYGTVEWNGRNFTVVDTGGITFDRKDSLSVQVRRQAETAILEADLILFLLDAREGPTPLDHDIAALLRRSGKAVIPVVNKVDSLDCRIRVYPFYRFGLGEIASISAAHGREIGDLLDCIVAELPVIEAPEYPKDMIRVAVVGRPNVGKSSLVNAMLGRERVIVDERPGTTREAVDTPFRHDDRQYLLIDTAGVRRKSRVREPVEYYSVLRALKAVDRSDVTLLLLDGSTGIVEQDIKLAGLADQAGRGLIVVVNKWDLIEKREEAAVRFKEKWLRSAAFAGYAPVTFISALSGRRVDRLFPTINAVFSAQHTRIPTALLNELVGDAVAVNPPPTFKGCRLKIFYAAQIRESPPTFVLFVNDPVLMHFSYLRYLENRVRESFVFVGTPIRFKLRKRRQKGEGW